MVRCCDCQCYSLNGWCTVRLLYGATWLYTKCWNVKYWLLTVVAFFISADNGTEEETDLFRTCKKEHSENTDDTSRTSDVCTDTSVAAESLGIYFEDEYVLSHEQAHKPHECQLCHKKFRSKITLEVHLQRTHTEEKKFKCSACDRTFSQKSDLKRHERVHTGERPFRCEICSNMFKQKCHLEVHLKSVHVRERKWKCSMCDSTFGQSANLRRHQRVHTGERPFKCEVCPKTFAQKFDLVVHFKTVHAGERKWKCSICGSAFGRSTHLRRHERVHSREWPTKCGICRRRFVRQHDLFDHYVRVHEGKQLTTVTTVCPLSRGYILTESVGTESGRIRCVKGRLLCVSSFGQFDKVRSVTVLLRYVFQPSHTAWSPPYGA